MLLRTDPFQVFDRLTQQFFAGTPLRSAPMPLDAYHDGDHFVVHLDLPGVSPEAIDVTVRHNVLTVTAQRTTVTDEAETLISERPTGTFSRQLFLGDHLDTANVEAGYDAGVLTLRIPVAEQAKPRKIAIASGMGTQQAISA